MVSLSSRLGIAQPGRLLPSTPHTTLALEPRSSPIRWRSCGGTAPTAMLAPLTGSGVMLVVTAGLRSYVQQRKAQLSMLGITAAGLTTVFPQTDWNIMESVASQVAQHPEAASVETWVTGLLASSLLRVATCAALCFATARYFDKRQARSDELMALLTYRQDTLHRFSTAVLNRLRELGVEDELGAVGAFREWYMAQLATSDDLLRTLRAGSAAGSAVEQLQGVMEWMELTAAELAHMSNGEKASGRKSSSSKHGGVAKALGRQQRIVGRRLSNGGRHRRDSMQKERRELERLVRLRTREEHDAAFQTYVQEMEAHLERSLQAQEPQPEAPARGGEPFTGHGQGGQPAASCQPSASPSPCSSDNPLATFDEGDCDKSADAPELGIDWDGLAVEWDRLEAEWERSSGSGSMDTASE